MAPGVGFLVLAHRILSVDEFEDFIDILIEL